MNAAFALGKGGKGANQLQIINVETVFPFDILFPPSQTRDVHSKGPYWVISIMQPHIGWPRYYLTRKQPPQSAQDRGLYPEHKRFLLQYSDILEKWRVKMKERQIQREKERLERELKDKQSGKGRWKSTSPQKSPNANALPLPLQTQQEQDKEIEEPEPLYISDKQGIKGRKVIDHVGEDCATIRIDKVLQPKLTASGQRVYVRGMRMEERKDRGCSNITV
ncbi:MAG: hypothetical protein EZS28_040478 [Streblomastix strix]|uniref:Uncharacterized protein n=1 Tax=Streblomastix strix TaxID=222440 RepID=A0A5J4U2Z2_9EUKA|nr:MAG: hypothetical protein EZS28_040478 [Streblomastix strix]